jgi:hypothetical protein
MTQTEFEANILTQFEKAKKDFPGLYAEYDFPKFKVGFYAGIIYHANLTLEQFNNFDKSMQTVSGTYNKMKNSQS